MDKLTRYQHLVKHFMSEFARLVNPSAQRQNSEMMLLFDDEHQQYLLLTVGWTKNGHLHHPTLHVYFRQEKFWIEQDWTEEGFATYLLEQGVPRDDIVLAFQPPEMRPLTEFAVA